MYLPPPIKVKNTEKVAVKNVDVYYSSVDNFIYMLSLSSLSKSLHHYNILLLLEFF